MTLFTALASSIGSCLPCTETQFPNAYIRIIAQSFRSVLTKKWGTGGATASTLNTIALHCIATQRITVTNQQLELSSQLEALHFHRPSYVCELLVPAHGAGVHSDGDIDSVGAGYRQCGYRHRARGEYVLDERRLNRTELITTLTGEVQQLVGLMSPQRGRHPPAAAETLLHILVPASRPVRHINMQNWRITSIR